MHYIVTVRNPLFGIYAVIVGVMGDHPLLVEFTDKVPPRFGGSSDDASYRADVLIWIRLTGTSSAKKGIDMVCLLSGEARCLAKCI